MLIQSDGSHTVLTERRQLLEKLFEQVQIGGVRGKCGECGVMHLPDGLPLWDTVLKYLSIFGAIFDGSPCLELTAVMRC